MLFYSLYARSLGTIERWQSSSLSHLVAYARKNVPLYSELYSHVTATTFRTITERTRLPIIDKFIFINKQTEEYVDNSRPIFAPWKSTSGTTGEPFTFLPGLRAGNQAYADFTCFRFLLLDRKYNRSIRNTRIARIKMSSDRRLNRMFISTKDFLSDIPAAVAHLAKYNPHVIETFPSLLVAIAHEVSEKKSSSLLYPPYVVSYGEPLTAEAREFISRTLHTEVYDRYGLEELGVVGMECAQHDGFHILPESVIVEIIDKSGTPASDGTDGRIVVTSLMNYNMPFIRYDTGDIGRMSKAACACGLVSPRVWIQGRDRGPALELNGRRIIQLEFDVVLGQLMHSVKRYQVVKKNDESVLVRIVPGSSYTAETANEIEQLIRPIVGQSVQIAIEIVPSIVPRESGKSEGVRDESESRLQ